MPPVSSPVLFRSQGNRFRLLGNLRLLGASFGCGSSLLRAKQSQRNTRSINGRRSRLWWRIDEYSDTPVAFTATAADRASDGGTTSGRLLGVKLDASRTGAGQEFIKCIMDEPSDAILRDVSSFHGATANSVRCGVGQSVPARTRWGHATLSATALPLMAPYESGGFVARSTRNSHPGHYPSRCIIAVHTDRLLLAVQSSVRRARWTATASARSCHRNP
jgi:hypothetical protein